MRIMHRFTPQSSLISFTNLRYIMNSYRLATPSPSQASDLESLHLLGEPAFAIDTASLQGPFLMQLISSSDLWAFIGSQGAITAGRRNPDHALFPYYTQDKLFDMSHCSGSCIHLRVTPIGSTTPVAWTPFSEPCAALVPCTRRVIKSFSGSKIALEEHHHGLGLTVRITWTTSNAYGILRQTSLIQNETQALSVEILDGMQNILPASVDQQFQNEFSILVDAYKRNEWFEPGLATYSLSSVPTDKAEPSESLRCTAVWATGFPGEGQLLCTDQVQRFRAGQALHPETETRGRRGAYLRYASFRMEACSSHNWWMVADMDQSAAKVIRTRELLRTDRDLAQKIETAIREDCDQLYAMVSEADGIQCCGKDRNNARHFSNTLFNLMRGGTFPHGYKVPTRDLLQHIQHCNRESFERHQRRLEALPDVIELSKLRDTLSEFAGPELTRIAEEYLPLTFSRRHGDPSRPWNRFSIDISDDHDQPIYAYQGNWRDIFQNWEALLHSYPLYTDSVISRFLNASTADGYNPYRVTKSGFEWEREEPGSPWSNIGYWGDHQIVYLLKLLEFSSKAQPTHLPTLLNQARYAFADVPYRIKSHDEILQNARNSICYDHAYSDRIDARTLQKGSDGQLLHDSKGRILHATLMEKLLIPLITKLSNFVPDAGIWMNTQRPEWNDANNALAGYGASVVTLGYLHRYLQFLEHLLQTMHPAELQLHTPVLQLLDNVHGIFTNLNPESRLSDRERGSAVHALGRAGTLYRTSCYDGSFGEAISNTNAERILEALHCFRKHVAATLRHNRREDALYHAYNLLHFLPDGSVSVENLALMLEGQVSILSSGILNLEECVELTTSLMASDLYREDQQSFLLYPNRSLPNFIEKGAIPTSVLAEYPDAAQLLQRTDSGLAQQGPDQRLRFHASFRNAGDLEAAMQRLNLPTRLQEEIHRIYEATFHHHAFTGRSGTFFAYEGLGSIYWHMVSKLLLAVQEVILQNPSSSPARSRLIEHYFSIRKGIGLDKSPAEYGAFPTDAYSHTPAHAGAQQPGMTGQVKEDLLVRLGELGLHIRNGSLHFEPVLLQCDDFTTESMELLHADDNHKLTKQPVSSRSIAFTFCHTPITYHLDENALKTTVQVHFRDGSIRTMKEAKLDTALTAQLFERKGFVEHITVTLPAHLQHPNPSATL